MIWGDAQTPARDDKSSRLEAETPAGEGPTAPSRRPLEEMGGLPAICGHAELSF